MSKPTISASDTGMVEFIYEDYTIVVNEINVGDEDEHGNMDLILDYEVTQGIPPDDFEEVLGNEVLKIIERAARDAED